MRRPSASPWRRPTAAPTGRAPVAGGLLQQVDELEAPSEVHPDRAGRGHLTAFERSIDVSENCARPTSHQDVARRVAATAQGKNLIKNEFSRAVFGCVVCCERGRFVAMARKGAPLPGGEKPHYRASRRSVNLPRNIRWVANINHSTKVCA